MTTNKPKEEMAEKRLKARELWLKGMAHNRIATEVGIRKQTLYNWAKKDNWNIKEKEITQQVAYNQEIDIIKEKERSLQLIRATESLYAQELKANKDTGLMPKSVPAFTQLQKAKWEILMPKTISQYNFMKTETNNTLITNEEANRAMEALKEYERRIANKSN